MQAPRPAGAGALNTCCNRPRPGRRGGCEWRHGAWVFRIGDKVIQIRNNYDKGAAGVFNGTVGTITALSVVDRQLCVRTDETKTSATTSTSSTSSHAYAITVHRLRAANTRPWSCR